MNNGIRIKSTVDYEYRPREHGASHAGRNGFPLTAIDIKLLTLETENEIDFHERGFDCIAKPKNLTILPTIGRAHTFFS